MARSDDQFLEDSGWNVDLSITRARALNLLHLNDEVLMQIDNGQKEDLRDWIYSELEMFDFGNYDDIETAVREREIVLEWLKHVIER